MIARDSRVMSDSAYCLGGRIKRQKSTEVNGTESLWVSTNDETIDQELKVIDKSPPIVYNEWKKYCWSNTILKEEIWD